MELFTQDELCGAMIVLTHAVNPWRMNVAHTHDCRFSEGHGNCT